MKYKLVYNGANERTALIKDNENILLDMNLKQLVITLDKDTYYPTVRLVYNDDFVDGVSVAKADREIEFNKGEFELELLEAI